MEGTCPKDQHVSLNGVKVIRGVEGLLCVGGEGGQMEEETLPLRGSEGGFYIRNH